jgi:tetratricopeptide (TPR) repeat protein
MKSSLLSIALFFTTLIASAQLTFPADGGNKKASVSEDIGLTHVTVHYDRPAVKGREGKIWGELIPVGFAPNPGFGSVTKMPWRAGANENTTITFSTDVIVEGKKLAAGTYGFFIAYDPKECTLIFSKDNEAWGSFFYNESNDALRVNVKPKAINESRERLTYSFDDQSDSSAVLSLYWEKLRIPFTISTELQKLQLASIDREMNTSKGFSASSFYEVANYYLEHNIMLDKALMYISSAERTMPIFNTYAIKAEIEEKLGKTKESAESLKKAVAATNSANQAHYYGRNLMTTNKQKAFEIFKMNYEHYPDVFTTNMGMARGYSAIGNYKEALKYANKALPQAPDATNKTAVEKNIASLKEGKDINTL